MGILLVAAIQGGLWLLSKAMAPDVKKQLVDRALIGDLNIPRAKEGMPVPLYWGRVRIKAPNLVWVGGTDSTPLQQNGEGPTLAIVYQASLQFILGIPGAKVGSPSGPIAQLNAFMIGEKVAAPFVPPLNGESTTTNWDAIDQPNFFGGDFQGGGIRGTIAFYGGAETQEYTDFGTRENGDFVSIFEYDAAAYTPPADDLLPRYYGQTMVTLTNFRLGESLINLPPFSFDVTSRVPSMALGTQLFPIGQGDANPVAVLVDILTSKWAKLGHDISNIDTANFLAVGQALDAEQHGFSHVLYDPTRAVDLIQEILTQIDAFLYQEPETGLLTLKLIREDYDPVDLMTVDPSNVDEKSEPAYAVSLWSETYNKVLVTYTDRRKGYAERTAPAHNQANIAINGGKIRALERFFPGVHTPELAEAIAHRLLRAHSLPLAKLRVTMNREGFALRPGSCFRFTWPDYGLSDVVFRVASIDQGVLEDGRIVVDAVQDKFAVGYVPFETPTWEVTPIAGAAVIADRVATEAPRFLQARAYQIGAINDAEVQRGLFVAVAEGQDIAYRADVSNDDEATWQLGMDFRSFPPHATVATSYSRLLEPYDTSTGLVITGLTGLTAPTTSSSANIQFNGRNLILVGGTELMSYETYTDNLDGTFTLTNVWRGDLDTPAVAHDVGEDVYWVGTGVIGSRGLTVDDLISARLVPRAFLSQLDPALAEVDTFTVRGRAVLPYPPADLLLDASKTPSALEEDGVDVSWRRRNYEIDRVTQGSAPDQVPTDTEYDVMARKGTDAYVAIETATDLVAASMTDLPLGSAGHGTIDVAVRAHRANPDGGADLTAWADPSLPILAYEWRNMLRDPRFAVGVPLDRWTIVSGPVTAGTTGAVALGGAGKYATASIKWDINQTVDVGGFLPERLRAIVDCYVRNVSGSSDTARIDLIALDASDNVLSTSTYGPTAQSTLWAKASVSVATLPAATAMLKVRLNCDIQTVATEVILRLGQISDQLLLNPDFSAGVFTSWTQVSGTWQALTATKYLGGHYVRPNDGASAELAQTVACPAGFEHGTAVLEVARMNDATLDTGAVTLEARDASNNVLATATTGAEALSPIDVWQRRRLFLTLPDATTQVRVRFVATRVSGTPLNSCIDDFDLRIHKQLEPVWTLPFELDEPTVQYLPQTRNEWLRRFPDVTPPDLGMWAGDSFGGITGNEPDMDSDDVLTGSKLVGCYDSTTMATDALEFVAGGAPLTTANVTFGNFDSAQAFTAGATLQTDVVAAATIVERLNATGWSLDLDGTGHVRARLVGSTTKTLTSAAVIADGGVHQVEMIHDVTNSLLRLVVDGVASSTSTSGLGEIELNDLSHFTIGEDFVGLIARLNLWRTALAVADAQSLWTHAGEPTGVLSYTRSGTLAVVVGSDDDGVLVGRFGADQVAMGYNVEFDTTGETGFGIAQVPAFANLCPTNDLTAASWVNTGATVTTPAIATPDGTQRAARITGDSTDYLAMNFTHGTANAFACVVWFARADVAHTAKIVISSDANGVRETTTKSITTTWQRFEMATINWNVADAGDGEIRFYPSNDGTSRTIDIAGPFFVGRVASTPVAIPMPLTTGAAAAIGYATALPLQFSHEGEIVVEAIGTSDGATDGVLVAIDNGSNDNDRRDLYTDGGGDEPKLDHANSTGAIVTSNAGPVSWDGVQTIRGRWCRAGLIEAASAFAGIVDGSDTGAAADYGRAATWTASAVALDRVTIGDGAVGEPFNGLIRRVTLYSRETRLPPP